MRFLRFLTWGRWWRHVIAGIERQRRRVDAEVKHFICERGRLQVGQSTRWYEAAMAPNEQLVFARHLDPAIWFHGLVDHGRVDPQRTAAQRVLLGHEAVFERVRRGAVRQDAA